MTREEFEQEIKRKNFVRALYIAKELNISEDELKNLAYEALWQVAGIGRNPFATKQLAQELGFSKDEVKEILQKKAEQEAEKNKKIVGFCYDYRRGKYLSFEKWLERLLKDWNKIN